jgi:hypothetical protein
MSSPPSPSSKEPLDLAPVILRLPFQRTFLLYPPLQVANNAIVLHLPRPPKVFPNRICRRARHPPHATSTLRTSNGDFRPSHLFMRHSPHGHLLCRANRRVLAIIRVVQGIRGLSWTRPRGAWFGGCGRWIGGVPAIAVSAG